MINNKLNHRIVIFISVALATLFSSSPLFAATVENIRLWPAPDHTRLVLDMSGPVEHNFFILDGPRLVIDIDNTQFKADLDDLDLRNTPIKNIRTGANGDRLRIVLDMKETVNTNFFALKKMGDINDRLVLDMEYRGASAKPAVILQDPTTDGRRDIIVAIDAGHGGEDPGAPSVAKVYEKVIVYDISRKLEKMINDTPGYSAFLIRSGDYYVELKQRRHLARQKAADLFLSIHADTVRQQGVHGASVYALDIGGRLATSETARYLAERANESDLIGGVGKVSIKDKGDHVASTLMDLSQTATLSASLQTGQYILDALAGVTKLHKPSVEQADFEVLRSPDMPSLLIETGFISNPAEAKRLSTPHHRQKIADGIFAGVKRYYYDHTPSGTYIAWQKLNGIRDSEHVVSRGETLSGIALRYHVSVSDLVSFNQLKDTNIRFGQKIKIPST
jgi:N-acetylmuramoyl-L-alanine amidase